MEYITVMNTIMNLRTTWCTFRPQPQIFLLKNPDFFSPKKHFLISWEMELSQKKLLLYFGKWNFLKKLLIFQEGTFQAHKIKKTHSEKMSYISGIGTF